MRILNCEAQTNAKDAAEGPGVHPNKLTRLIGRLDLRQDLDNSRGLRQKTESIGVFHAR